MQDRLAVLQKLAALKIAAGLPEDTESALAILEIARQLVQWKPTDGKG